MRIGIDARALTGPYTGDRTYWRSLILSLSQIDVDNEYLLFSRTTIPAEDIPPPDRFQAFQIPASNDRIWTIAALPHALKQHRADLLHAQYTLPPICPCPAVTTVHDITFRLFPQWFRTRDRILMNLTVPFSMRRASKVITDSVSSLQDIQREYKLPEGRVVAITLGLPQGFRFASGIDTRSLQATARDVLRDRYGLAGPFILALGVLQPRKNLEMLAAAYGKLKAKYSVEHKLVLVGKAGWLTARENVMASAERFGGAAARDGVLFPGYVPDDELETWYRGCTVFAHSSLYEGFGIPPLEAMACGAPTVVSDAPALPEVVGDAALIAPARDPDAWAEQLYTLVSDTEQRERLSKSGQERARSFSWQTTAEKTLQVYRSIGR
jgi:glycosyltransferase involved in cell wall biosynthesis